MGHIARTRARYLSILMFLSNIMTYITIEIEQFEAEASKLTSFLVYYLNILISGVPIATLTITFQMDYILLGWVSVFFDLLICTLLFSPQRMLISRC